jgi:radical SAM protein with 4Fe4S-binding SPASM domain
LSNDAVIPQAVIWIMNGTCNLRCIHCYANRFIGVEELKLEEKLKLIDELAECGVSYIGITGGEPLINPDLEQCLRRAHDYGIECSINTNAQCLDEKAAEVLERYYAYLFISMEGSRREVHERIRGPGTWDKLMRGIEVVRRAGLSFSTVMTINSLNYLDAAEYVELAERFGADDACMIPVMPVGRASQEIAPSTSQLITALKSAESVAKSLGYWINVWCYVPGKLIIDPRYISTWADCRRGRVVDIDPAGDILLCDILDIRLGNVKGGFRQAVKEYLQSREMNEVMNPRLREPCKSCNVRESCMGGCYARSYLIFKNFDGPDPYCPRINMDLYTKAVDQVQKS